MLSKLQVLSDSDYLDQRFAFILAAEESGTLRFDPYDDDNPATGGGNPSIGVGFNLRDSTVNQNAVFDVLGINTGALAGYAEAGYVTELRTVLNQASSGNTSLRNELNLIMDRRFNDPNVPLVNGQPKLQEFRFDSVDQIKSVFNLIAMDFENTVSNDFPDFPNSNERLVLFSLAYNERRGNRLLGSALTRAINIDGNRAEAWYEIRYNSNLGDVGGVARRRYFESDTFGLYGEGVDETNITQEIALQVYKTYTDHRTDILNDELINGAGAQVNRIDSANRDFQSFLNGNTVNGLEESFKLAYDFLIKNFVENTDVPIKIDYRDIYVGGEDNDNISATGRDGFEITQDARPTLIIGGEGDDIIFGDAFASDLAEEFHGSDNLSGGAGNDQILGNGGNDIIFGDEGADTLVGGIGVDNISGGTGNGQITGGVGNDILAGGSAHTYNITAHDNADIMLNLKLSSPYF